MGQTRLKLHILLPLSIAGLVVISVLFFLVAYRQPSRPALPQYGEVPQFQFEESRGFAFGSSDMQGKINVVDFIFTSCQSACPVMSARMAELYRRFQHDDRIQFVSISVDPENDTAEVLQAYAERYGVSDRRWVFLRAGADSVKWLAEKGFKVSGGPPMMHSTKFILVDAAGRIRGYYDPFDANTIKQLTFDIQHLLGRLQ